MRRNPVATEVKLWELLRDRRLDGVKFRRQVPIGPYVVDFLALRFRLVIEADGPLHDLERDAVRDKWLMSQGFRVIRFSNARITTWPHQVLDVIRAAAGLERVLSGPLDGVGQEGDFPGF